MKCWYCNNEVDDDSMFCKYCGKQLAHEDKIEWGYLIPIVLFLGSIAFYISCSFDIVDIEEFVKIIFLILLFGALLCVVFALLQINPKLSAEAQKELSRLKFRQEYHSLDEDDRDLYRAIKEALLANKIIICIIGIIALALIGVGIFYPFSFNDTYYVITYCVGVLIAYVPAAVIGFFVYDAWVVNTRGRR